MDVALSRSVLTSRAIRASNGSTISSSSPGLTWRAGGQSCRRSVGAWLTIVTVATAGDYLVFASDAIGTDSGTCLTQGVFADLAFSARCSTIRSSIATSLTRGAIGRAAARIAASGTGVANSRADAVSMLTCGTIFTSASSICRLVGSGRASGALAVTGSRGVRATQTGVTRRRAMGSSVFALSTELTEFCSS